MRKFENLKMEGLAQQQVLQKKQSKLRGRQHKIGYEKLFCAMPPLRIKCNRSPMKKKSYPDPTQSPIRPLISCGESNNDFTTIKQIFL
jgi:hypothetical protein